MGEPNGKNIKNGFIDTRKKCLQHRANKDKAAKGV